MDCVKGIGRDHVKFSPVGKHVIIVSKFVNMKDYSKYPNLI